MTNGYTREEHEFLSSLTLPRGYQPVAKDGVDDDIPPSPPRGRAGVSEPETENQASESSEQN
jgi:hypothetical protein